MNNTNFFISSAKCKKIKGKISNNFKISKSAYVAEGINISKRVKSESQFIEQLKQ